MDNTVAESSSATTARSSSTPFRWRFRTAPGSTQTTPTEEQPNDPDEEDTEEDTTEDANHEFWEYARRYSRYKLRSMTTSRDDHLPTLLDGNQAITSILLGDSMIERMTTTGKAKSLQLWPSEAMWPEKHAGGLRETNLRREALSLPQLVRINGMLNAGCGGDKIENVIYRLIGDPGQGLTGLVKALASSKRAHKVKLWVIHAGTNNLHPKKGLTDESVQAFRVLLETILTISDDSVHILVTGLFYRKDIKDELVDQADAKLKKLVHDIAWEFSPDYPGQEQQLTEEGVSHVDFGKDRDAPEVVDVKGKGKALGPEERRDSAIGVAITPAVTREGSDIKGKGKAKEVLPGTPGATIDNDTGEPQPTERDPTMPQFKPNWWPSIFSRDPGAVGLRRASPENKPRSRPSEYRSSDYDYPRVQFLPAPRGKDPEAWLEDDVHLHEEGYRIWTRKLFPKTKEMLSYAEEASP